MIRLWGEPAPSLPSLLTIYVEVGFFKFLFFFFFYLECIWECLHYCKKFLYILRNRVFILRKHYSKAFWFIPGEVDVQMVTLLQSSLPAVPITVDIVEGSSQLTDNFKGIDTPPIMKRSWFIFFPLLFYLFPYFLWTIILNKIIFIRLLPLSDCFIFQKTKHAE